MGSIYYQQDNDLDSLSNVKGFSSALNGKTYGFKKQGGIFIPEDISSGGGGVSGVIPDGGLYLDGANRVGVLLDSDSGLITDSTGLSVLLDPDGGLESTMTGLAIKETDSIDPSGPNVKVDNSMQITSSGVGVKIGDNSLEIDPANGLEVRVAAASAIGKDGSGFLDVKTGDGISKNPTTGVLTANVDGSSITINGSGQLQANFGTIPAFATREVKILFTNFSFGGSGTMATIKDNSNNNITLTIPNNWSAMFSFNCDIEANSNGITFDTDIRPIISFSSTASLNNTYIQSGDYWQGFNDGGVRSGVFKTCQNITGAATNQSGSSVSVTFSIAHNGPNGTGMVMQILGGTYNAFLFPIQP